MGKYWAVQLLARLSVIFAGLFVVGGLAWLFMVMFGLVHLLFPMIISGVPPEVVAVLGAGALGANFVVTIGFWFAALMWLVYGQILLMMLEVTENTRHLRKLPGAIKNGPEAVPEPPWARRGYSDDD